MTDFQNQLRSRAERLDLSLAEVARRAGVSNRRISHYASGRSEPDLQTLIEIAKVLDTTPDGLLFKAAKKARNKATERDRLFAQIMVGCRSLNDSGVRLISVIVGQALREDVLVKDHEDK